MSLEHASSFFIEISIKNIRSFFIFYLRDTNNNTVWAYIFFFSIPIFNQQITCTQFPLFCIHINIHYLCPFTIPLFLPPSCHHHHIHPAQSFEMAYLTLCSSLVLCLFLYPPLPVTLTSQIRSLEISTTALGWKLHTAR